MLSNCIERDIKHPFIHSFKVKTSEDIVMINLHFPHHEWWLPVVLVSS